MMRMPRPITFAEIDGFCGLSADPVSLHDRLVRMFEGGMSSPDLCPILESDGKFTAGVVYLTFPSTPGEFGLWRMFRSAELGNLTASVDFIQQSLRLLKRFNAARLEAQVSSLDDDVNYQRALFEACGFQIFQVKARYEFHPSVRPPETAANLHFVPFQALGKDDFMALMAEVTRDTLDRSQRSDYIRQGGISWAQIFYELLLSLDQRQSLWRVGMVEGQAIGLVVPQVFGPDTGVINYIGVVPTHRGRGISRELLKVGTAELIHDGVRTIIADIDIENFPLANSLVSVGYCKTSELLGYHFEMATLDIQ